MKLPPSPRQEGHEAAAGWDRLTHTSVCCAERLAASWAAACGRWQHLHVPGGCCCRMWCRMCPGPLRAGEASPCGLSTEGSVHSAACQHGAGPQAAGVHIQKQTCAGGFDTNQIVLEVCLNAAIGFLREQAVDTQAGRGEETFPQTIQVAASLLCTCSQKCSRNRSFSG